jgi:hypothetical protein
MGSTKVIFLGLAERVDPTYDGRVELHKWNVIGLRNVIASPIYPCRLSGWQMAIAVSVDDLQAQYNLELVAQDGSIVGTIAVTPEVFTSPEALDSIVGSPSTQAMAVQLLPQKGWSLLFLALGDTPIAVPAPGVYDLVEVRADQRELAGQIIFALFNPEPYSIDQLIAIRSNPYASKAVRLELGCQRCPSKLRAYSALEKLSAEGEEGYSWYQDLPEEFICECKATKINLSSIRRNLFVFLGRDTKRQAQVVKFVPQYGHGMIRNIQLAFIKLLEKKGLVEEEIQKFIEGNPITLHQFTALRILWKPSLFNQYKADIGILTPNKQLVLIELENANIRLMKKDGGIASSLQHAFDQVTDWLQIADDHRQAILSDLDIRPENVGSISAVIIAGRDHRQDAFHLRKLKGNMHGRIMFMTYDDIIEGLEDLGRRLLDM